MGIASLFVTCPLLRGHQHRLLCFPLVTGFHPGELQWGAVLIIANSTLLIFVVQSENSRKTQNAFMLFFASCLWKSLGGLIAMDRILGSRIIYEVYNLVFPKWCLYELL